MGFFRNLIGLEPKPVSEANESEAESDESYDESEVEQEDSEDEQEELDKQVLSAVKLQRGDGGWVMGRKASGIICGAVSAAMVTHFATRAETEVDIQFG